ncbi:MAG: TraB/GumN family protein [Flavobacteriales bacterium]
MKNIFMALAILSSINGLAQDTTTNKQHKGLLWEIKGNGLKETSYLYGTMHVSGRIAYHLGEEFFAGLNSVDAIALESNPIIWLDEIVNSRYADNYLGRYGIERQTYRGFYKKAFEVEVPKNKNYARALSSNHYLANWMLYRENARNKEFEEDTFLDMFIYQSGSKNSKPVYSLEEFEQSRVFSMMSQIPDVEKKERSEWYKKLTKEKGYYEILEDAYRDQDLDMLDSLQAETSSVNSMKYMLYMRNEIMADNIDSIVQAGTSLFIGIGAAHLANDKGVIGLLRKMGYTVEPATRTISDKARDEKERLSKMKKPLPFSNTFKNEFFTLKVPGTVYETPGSDYERQFFSPELTNGTFYTFRIISTYGFFKGAQNKDYKSKIDSLLFENIPGKIESKKDVTKNGYEGLDILNKTKSGDYQRYQIYFTPTNILLFKMGGKDDFVKKESDKFFGSLELTPLTSKWATASTIKNDFSVQMPSYHHVKGNTKATSMYSHPEIEGYDSKTKTYYFLKRASLHDMRFIEEDNYELDRIPRKFCKELKIDSVDTWQDSTTKYPTGYGSARTADSSYLSMKVVIKGAYYYLLATVSSQEIKENKFFNSFKFGSFKYKFPFEARIDSTLNFKVTSNYISPNPYSQMIRKGYEKRRNRKETEDKSYLSKRKSETYYSENYERVNVEYDKFHRYKFVKHIDTIFNRETKNFAKRKDMVLLKSMKGKDGDFDFVDAYFTDTNSTRVIRKKYIIDRGTMYTLTTNLDSISQDSKFISEFYNSFTPYDTTEQLKITESKSDLFFNALKSRDSLETERAMKSVISTLIFEDEDAPRIMDVISNYDFPTKHLESKVQLITDLGGLKDKRIAPFLTQLYDKSEDTAMYQIAILKGLSKQRTKASTKEMVRLIEKDIPLSSSSWGVSSMFYSFYDSLELTKHLYPSLLDYTFVDPYKRPIYDLMIRAVDSNKLKARTYRKEYKQILREAKIELKKQISSEQTSQAKEEDNSSYYYSNYKNQGNYKLVRYARLLMPYYKKPAVKEFFTKMKKVQDYEVQTNINCMLVSRGVSVDPSIWNHLAEDVVNKVYLYRNLKEIGKLELFPKEHLSQEMICKSILYDRGFNFKKDSLEFIKKVNCKRRRRICIFLQE